MIVSGWTTSSVGLASAERSRVDLRYMPLRFVCARASADSRPLQIQIGLAGLRSGYAPPCRFGSHRHHASGRRPGVPAPSSPPSLLSQPGAVIVIDGASAARHYADSASMICPPPAVEPGFSAHAHDDNAQRLMILHCLRSPPPPRQFQRADPCRPIARSYCAMRTGDASCSPPRGSGD